MNRLPRYSADCWRITSVIDISIAHYISCYGIHRTNASIGFRELEQADHIGVGEAGKAARSSLNGRSMEDEARDILRSALSTDEPRPRNLAQAIHERFGPLGGVGLPGVSREAIRPPADFDA